MEEKIERREPLLAIQDIPCIGCICRLEQHSPQKRHFPIGSEVIDQRLKKPFDLLRIPRVGTLIDRNVVVMAFLKEAVGAEQGDGAGLDFLRGEFHIR